MFSPFEASSSSPSRRSKQLIGGTAGKWTKVRRLANQLMCRQLPLLTLWTLIVILILYKSLNYSNEVKKNQDTTTGRFQASLHGSQADSHQQQQQALPIEALTLKNRLQTRQSPPNGFSQLRTLPPTSQGTNDEVIDSATKVITKSRPIHRTSATASTTRRSTNEDYLRTSKVFILIVQDEVHRNMLPSSPIRRSYESQHRSGSGDSSSKNAQRRMSVPAHIRLLIGILDSHRIEYTIDTIRTGLPASLLADQDNTSVNKQYSVIIIDDFIRYTKLSRWVRDQLDRHCRLNQIGVVTYLSSELPEELRFEATTHSKYGRNTLLTKLSNSASGDESLADQFPLTFRPINQQSCRNFSSTNCLVDYQLNERATILRLLKRRPDFILSGPLISNLNQSPWITMSSNHVTYEPLTWAKLRRRDETRKRRMVGQRQMHYSSNSKVTREMDQPVALDMKSVQVDKNVDESSEHQYQTTEAYEENQQRMQGQQPSEQIDQNNPASSHETISFESQAHPSSDESISEDNNDDMDRQVLSMFDRGLYDGIKRVIFGGANHHWLNRALLLDAIEHLSRGRILSPLERYIQIDIDDIFVGERGKRMNRSDVEALIETQHFFGQQIGGGFKFNLGFSGKYFKHGQEEENAGDEELINRAQEFSWFCHTWSHSKAHLLNDTLSIENELKKNLKFAREHRLPIIGHGGKIMEKEDETILPTYAVAPHHSGVYPIHSQLYEAWRSVLNVQVTSTEEYPGLRPANARRAFVHETIKVLPRQTCGLYTHTIYRDKYPGGFEKLEASIRGGELFETILHNQVNIYMTHMSNYANDRLAPYTFAALFDFVQAYTNLQLKSASSSVDDDSNQLGPAKLADHYFSLYPAERQPLWTNPCNDKRHLAIWAPEKHNYCAIVPKLLIVGPQKTGTTALHSYLKANPLLKSSFMSSIDFEEVQFFNDKHYSKGVDWYFSRFMRLSKQTRPKTGSNTGPNSTTITTPSGEDNDDNNDGSDLNEVYFDKSATYFDDPKVPRRASALLPEAYIVILLVNPADRAYSWYHHIKAHGDSVANSLSFEQVIMSRDSSNDSSKEGAPMVNPAAVGALRNRCLHPGYYSQHLNKWLEHYPSRQIIIIDGQWFRYNPASVMNRLQLLLRLEQVLDYSKLLVYDEQKGFYCQRANGTNGNDDASIKCLGKSKGRKYPAMSEDARLFLNRLYWPHNRQLARLLSDIGQPLPTWLDEAMNLLGRSHASGSVMY